LSDGEELSHYGPMDQKARHARLLQFIDIAGTFVLAIQGASIAAVKGLDALGVVVVSLATATGGGVMRDLLIGETPPEALRGWPIVTSALMGALVTFFAFHMVEEIPEAALTVVDALGLALLAVSGTEKALEFRLTPIAAVMMGGISGAGGYTIRDILLAQVPRHPAGRLSRHRRDYRRDRPGRRAERQSARQRRRLSGRRDMLRPANPRGVAALASADGQPVLRASALMRRLTLTEKKTPRREDRAGLQRARAGGQELSAPDDLNTPGEALFRQRRKSGRHQASPVSPRRRPRVQAPPRLWLAPAPADWLEPARAKRSRAVSARRRSRPSPAPDGSPPAGQSWL
jgi:Glycine transporter